MKHSCYILDDEPSAVELLKHFILKTPGLVIVGSALYPIVAQEQVRMLKPNLIFCDVDMPGLSGLDFAEKIPDSSLLIFTTSFREYALEAFEKRAIDYLLKPFSYERFSRSIDKYYSLSQHLTETVSPETLMVKTGLKGNFQKVILEDIIYISSLLNYVEMHLNNRKIITYGSMDAVLSTLQSTNFLRIHKSYIINRAHLLSTDSFTVSLTNGMSLPIGKVYRKAFQDVIGS